MFALLSRHCELLHVSGKSNPADILYIINRPVHRAVHALPFSLWVEDRIPASSTSA